MNGQTGVGGRRYRSGFRGISLNRPPRPARLGGGLREANRGDLVRIGICTGGGDCPGLNAVIYGAAKHAIGVHGMEVWGIRDGLTGLMEEPMGVCRLTSSDVTGILGRGGTILGTTNRGSPFRTKDGGDEAKRKIMAAWKKLGLDGVIAIGGDGTQMMASHLAAEGMPIIGIPKTIDNDLFGTDRTVGFSTAVEVAAEAAGRLQTSAEAHDRIMILEVMGRDAGHIALHAGLASGANIALIPEIPFTYEAVIDKITERQNLGRKFSLIVVAEGAYEKGKAPIYQAPKRNAQGDRLLGGIGHVIADELGQRTDMESRVTVLGHLQRGGPPNADDRILACSFATHAVDALASGRFGRVIGVKQGQFYDFPYSDLVDGRRQIDLNSPIIRTAEAVGIALGRKTPYSIKPGQ